MISKVRVRVGLTFLADLDAGDSGDAGYAGTIVLGKT